MLYARIFWLRKYQINSLSIFGIVHLLLFKVDLPPPRLQRSMSLSMRRSRDSNKKEDGSDKGLKRSSSVKGRNENKGETTSKDTIKRADQKPEKIKGEIEKKVDF